MMRYARSVTTAVAATAVLGITGAAAAQTAASPAHAPARAAAAAKKAAHGWKVVRVVKSSGSFSDVAASSWWNAWAVGTVAWRWNGHKWAKVALPSGYHPWRVSAAGVHNTWFLASKGQGRLRKWNKGKWSSVADKYAADAYTVGAAGKSQVWVGGKAVIRHFNGKKWTEKKLPSNVRIFKVAVNHYNDVWAVGEKLDGNEGQPYAMHWNGSTWRTTSVPAYHPDGGWLTSVAFVGKNDVFAAGENNPADSVHGPVLVHWNGTKWSKVSVPKSVHPAYGVNGVAPIGGGGIWYSWDLRHEVRRTPSGTWTDFRIPKKVDPYVSAIAHIPGTKITLGVGYAGPPQRPLITLGK